jgi:hypothetical protein
MLWVSVELVGVLAMAGTVLVILSSCGNPQLAQNILDANLID